MICEGWYFTPVWRTRASFVEDWANTTTKNVYQQQFLNRHLHCDASVNSSRTQLHEYLQSFLHNGNVYMHFIMSLFHLKEKSLFSMEPISITTNIINYIPQHKLNRRLSM